MDDRLASRRVVLTGRFKAFSQARLRDRLHARGALVCASVTPGVSLVVAGHKPGAAVMNAAAAAGIEVIDESQVMVLLGMADASGRMERLRELLHTAPSAEVWESLCEALDDWPGGEGLVVALDYARERLESWPEHLRVAPERWLRQGEERLSLAMVCGPQEGGTPGRLVHAYTFGRRKPALAALQRLAPRFGLEPRVLEALELGRRLPDGRRLQRKAWELQLLGATGRILARTPVRALPNADYHDAQTFSRCGKYVVCAGGELAGAQGRLMVRLLDADTLETLDSVLPEYGEPWFQAEIHHDPHTDVLSVVNHGDYGGSGDVYFVKIEQGRLHLHKGFLQSSERLTMVGFDPDCRRVVTHNHCAIEVWDPSQCAEPLPNGFVGQRLFGQVLLDLLEAHEGPNIAFGGAVGRWVLVPVERMNNFTFQGLLVYDHNRRQAHGIVGTERYYTQRHFKVLGQRLVMLHDWHLNDVCLLQFLPSVDLIKPRQVD